MTVPSASLIRWLDRWATSRQSSVRPPQTWESANLLGRFSSPGGAALAVRSQLDGSAVFAELVARHDETSTLAALSGIAPRLAVVRWHWWCCGTPEAEIGDLESELVTECISLMRSQPELPPAVLVRSARHRVYGQRRTERARTDRWTELDSADRPEPAFSGSPEEPALCSLPAKQAAALWLWACGWKTNETAELLGSTPQAIRAWRSRGIRALRAGRGLVP